MARLFQPEQLKLSNGIPVILQHYESPVAATYWWVKTGSADESTPEAGFAHFLEHMLFKDAAAKESGVASTGQMARTIESLGGDINAYTSFDQTVYHVTSAAQHWEKIIDAFGTMAKPQRFLKTDFEREREVILEELRKNEDSPGRQLFQSLFTSTFSKHPYGRPVIGFEKILRAAKINQLESFYRRNYVSGKMGLVLVGPIHDKKGEKKKNILKLLEKHFGSKVLKKTEGKFPSRVLEPELREKAQWSVKPFDVKTPTLSFSFRVPHLAHEDLPALDLLSSVLGMGELSRLYQRLFYKNSLVTDVSGGLYVPKDPGMLYFQAEMDSLDKMNRVTEEMLQELKRMGEEGPTSDELSRVLVNAESERLYATQTADGMAGRLGFLGYIMGDLEFDQQYLDDLRAVDATRIKEVANKYLDSRRMSGVVLVPKNDAKFDVVGIENLSHRLLDRAAGSTTQTQVKKAIQRSTSTKKKDADALLNPEYFQLPSGMRVCYHHRPSSHVFSVHASVLGGLRLEIAKPIERADTDWGSSYMMALTWTKGTPTRNVREIAATVEGKAASLDGFSGRNSVGLQMTGLARDWGSLSDLFTDVFLHPTYPKEEFDHSKRIVEDSIRGIEDHTSQLGSKLFLETLFQNHPYGRMTLGSLDSLRMIHPEKLRAFHKCWIRPERTVLAISGAVKWSALEPWLLRMDEKAQNLVKGVEPFGLPDHLPDEPTLKAPRWVEKSLGREQLHIIVGGLGTQIDAEDRHALRLLQTLLGGQSGRLFIELREKKSLAYTVAPISFEGLERGYAGTYIACSPQKKDEAIAGIAHVLEKLVSKGPNAQEMSRAKEFFMGRRAMDLQSDGALAAHFGLEALYDIPNLTEMDLLKKIKAITAKDIQAVCKKYLVDPQMVTSVVG
jgi:zinc protease